MTYICPFVFLGGLNIIPDPKYPPRLCVVDYENGIAIDVETNLKYDYIESSSRLYMGSIIDKIKNDRRVAVLTSQVLFNKDNCYKKALKIIKQLELGQQFEDGNLIFSNEQYLEYVNNFKEQTKQKTKKIEKRRK